MNRTMRRAVALAIAVIAMSLSWLPAQAESNVADQAAQAQQEAWLSENPAIAEAMSPEGQARLIEQMTYGKQQRQATVTYGHSHHHTDCLYWAQVYLNYVDPGATINEWPWALTGFRTPFMFYGDVHTQCELKNSYYGYPVYTWALLNIDHTPVDAGTHDWAIVPVGSF